MLLDTVLSLEPSLRARVIAALSPAERAALDAFMSDGTGKFAQYRRDPVRFVQEALHEAAWSKQVEILESVRDHKRTAVPACHAPGKSHIASRAVAWWLSCHPPGTALAVTTATNYRQVRNILWPHIRRAAKRHSLPGEVLSVEWKIGGDVAGYGFSAADSDEAAVQGIHAPNLLIVVDEAGGVSQQIGQALEALMTGSNTRLLVIGNPPTAEAGTWFEKCCGSPNYNIIPIPATATPNFTGEDAGVCGACPPTVPEHPVSNHLVDREWVDDVTREFGEGSAFVEARVHARFPAGSGQLVLSPDWVDAARTNTEAAEGSRIRLGVDVAADGGDEFVIARADGFTVSVVHTSSGAANADAVQVAGVVLEHIRQAEAMHRERGVRERVVVKVDSIGLGWGVRDLLAQWRREKEHGADIVGVNVSESARDPEKFVNQRAEVWWSARDLLRPDDGDGAQALRLDVDTRTAAQLSAPRWSTNSKGRIVIEPKVEVRKRTGGSPDRADAVLLALYEPPAKSRVPGVGGQNVVGANAWRGIG